jgi:cytochrome P450
MDDVLDRREVARILDDRRFTVPEADAAGTNPMERFRARVSRFANGPAHERRRRTLECLLARLDPAELATDAARRTRAFVAEAGAAGPGGIGPDVARVARAVPVACLAARLGFDRPDDLPVLVAAVAPSYASGVATDAADASVRRLLAAAPAHDDRQREGAPHDEGARELAVQLLVQAHAASAGLIEAAMRGARTAPAGVPTSDLLAIVLRDAPPVRSTRRVAPDGTVLTLHLGGSDAEAGLGHPLRALAFGAGPRACPAQDLALAIAGAIVDELRAC